jgi:hypothetical protein
VFLGETTEDFATLNLSLSLDFFGFWWKVFSVVINWWQVVICWYFVNNNISNRLFDWFLCGNFNNWLIFWDNFIR